LSPGSSIVPGDKSTLIHGPVFGEYYTKANNTNKNATLLHIANLLVQGLLVAEATVARSNAPSHSLLFLSVQPHWAHLMGDVLRSHASFPCFDEFLKPYW